MNTTGSNRPSGRPGLRRVGRAAGVITWGWADWRTEAEVRAQERLNRQVARQLAQVGPGLRGVRRRHALFEFVQGQPSVRERVAQDIHDALPLLVGGADRPVDHLQNLPCALLDLTQRAPDPTGRRGPDLCGLPQLCRTASWPEDRSGQAARPTGADTADTRRPSAGRKFLIKCFGRHLRHALLRDPVVGHRLGRLVSIPVGRIGHESADLRRHLLTQRVSGGRRRQLATVHPGAANELKPGFAGVRQGCFQMVTKSEVFWVSHRNSCSVTLLANLSSGQSESGVT